MVDQRRGDDVEDAEDGAAEPKREPDDREPDDREPDDREPGGDREPAEPPRDDPDAPGLSVEDTESDEAVEPNEPA